MSSLQSEFGHRRTDFLRRIPFFLGPWVMLWASLNTEPTRIGDQVDSWLDLFHGLRTYLVLLAAYLAGIMILIIRRSPPWPLFRGPLRLIAVYGLIGIISSLFFSPEPLVALYWAAAYVSVLVVLEAIFLGSNPVARIRGVITLNWLIVGTLSLALMVVSWDLLFLEGLTLGELEAPLPGTYVYTARPEIMGMPMVRATGVGRFAAVLGIVALCRILRNTSVRRLIWGFPLILSLIILSLFQSRGAIIGFVVASFVVLLLGLGIKAKSVILASGVSLLWAFGFPESIWQYLARGQSLEYFIYQMSGRRQTWEAGWEVFKNSPLLGFGFQADRFLVEEGQHMHNSLLQALVQTGILGTLPFVGAIASAWILLLRALRHLSHMSFIERYWLIETAGVLAFLSVLSISQSTGAFYGVDWLLLAPLLAHIQILSRNPYNSSTTSQSAR